MHSTSAVSPVSTPKVAALDYRSSNADFGGTAFDATALALHLKYQINILGMQPSQAQLGGVGRQFVLDLLADTTIANRIVGNYTIASQQYDSDVGAPTYADVYDKINAGGTSGGSWWAKNAATGLKTKTGIASGYTSWEVNLCPAYTTANASGQKAAEAIADGLCSMYYTTLYAAGARLFFQDNVWTNPGDLSTSNTFDSASNDLGVNGSLKKCGDYTLDGTNDDIMNSWALRNSAPNVEWRKGLANYVARMKSNLGAGLVAVGNCSADRLVDATFGNCTLETTELQSVYDYGFLEALTSDNGTDSSCINAYRGNFADVLNRYYSAQRGASVAVIVSCYVKTTSDALARTLQKARMCLGVTLLGDGYCAVLDRLTGSANLRPFWFKELEQPIGDATESSPTTAATGFDGMYKRAYSNGMAVVNPSSNKGRWMNNASGTLTLNRASNVVTLTWSAMPALTIVDNTTKVRIQGTSVDGGSFNGVFTITSHTATSLTWTDAGSDSTNSKPVGYWGVMSTVDFTALGLTGYKRFLTTEVGDTHDVYDAVGTTQSSQNDGTDVTTLSLWPNDAILLLRS